MHNATYSQASLYYPSYFCYYKEKSKMVTASVVKAGPWGGKRGSPWQFQPDGTIVGFTIRYYDECVASISFYYRDHDGVEQKSPTYGIANITGTTTETVKFVAGEEFTGISGTAGTATWGEVITSLGFQTNVGIYGPYGPAKATSTPFSLPVAMGKFVGFFGSSGDVLDAIGASLQPL